MEVTMKNMFVAFILNLLFAIFELVGGILTGSVAIASDAIHDLADAATIGFSAFLERKSHRPANRSYTFGYGRLSVMGALFTTCVLLAGSVLVIYRAVQRIIFPAPINYDGMLLFAIIGVAVNLGAALLTKNGHSVNERAVNLHLLEDVLGWIVVLIGAIVMRFTNFALLDPILSICVAVFIIINAIKNLKSALSPLLEKVPEEVSIDHLEESLLAVPEILSVSHVHVWSLDGENHLATAHISTNADPMHAKAAAREVLDQLGIHHATIEVDDPGADVPHCKIEHNSHHHHHHHHH
jgi:cobalt-zinc-cadmium efflux system protein